VPVETLTSDDNGWFLLEEMLLLLPRTMTKKLQLTILLPILMIAFLVVGYYYC